MGTLASQENALPSMCLALPSLARRCWCQCPHSIRQLTSVEEVFLLPVPVHPGRQLLQSPVVADGAQAPKLLLGELLLLVWLVRRWVAQFWVITSLSMAWMQLWVLLVTALLMLRRRLAISLWMQANSWWMQGSQWATSSWICSE